MKVITIKKTKDSKLECVYGSNSNQDAVDKAKELSESCFLVQLHELPVAFKKFWNEELAVKKVAKKASSKSGGNAE